MKQLFQFCRNRQKKIIVITNNYYMIMVEKLKRLSYENNLHIQIFLFLSNFKFLHYSQFC